ncbi:MAG: hypothetical protein ACREXW_01030 [Gammaproteobacteria bacterium]
MSEANTDTAAPLDLDKPETWPTDAEGLAGLADGERADENAAGKDKAPAAADDAAGRPAADADAKPLADAADPGKPGGDPEGVLTRDGKHVIPYDVLRSERDARKALEAQTAALTAELEALKKAQPAGAAADPEQPQKHADAAAAELPAEVEAKAEELRESYGDEFADQWLDNYKLKVQVAAVTRWAQAIESERAARDTAERSSEQDGIQAAIDAVPLMAEWQADSANPEWYARANELHQILMRSNPAYSEMSWAERMDELPGKVEAVYGESPHSAKARGATDTGKAAERAIHRASVRRPASMSDIPGGTPPAQSETEALERMSPAQLQAHLGSMAARNPERLESFLRGL